MYVFQNFISKTLKQQDQKKVYLFLCSINIIKWDMIKIYSFLRCVCGEKRKNRNFCVGVWISGKCFRWILDLKIFFWQIYDILSAQRRGGSKLSFFVFILMPHKNSSSWISQFGIFDPLIHENKFHYNWTLIVFKTIENSRSDISHSCTLVYPCLVMVIFIIVNQILTFMLAFYAKITANIIIRIFCFLEKIFWWQEKRLKVTWKVIVAVGKIFLLLELLAHLILFFSGSAIKNRVDLGFVFVFLNRNEFFRP